MFVVAAVAVEVVVMVVVVALFFGIVQSDVDVGCGSDTVDPTVVIIIVVVQVVVDGLAVVVMDCRCSGRRRRRPCRRLPCPPRRSRGHRHRGWSCCCSCCCSGCCCCCCWYKRCMAYDGDLELLSEKVLQTSDQAETMFGKARYQWQHCFLFRVIFNIIWILICSHVFRMKPKQTRDTCGPTPAFRVHHHCS